MMDTILNIGLTSSGIDGLARQNNSMHFALDSYRRLLQMFGAVVLHTPKKEFDRIIDAIRIREGVASDSELSLEALKEICMQFKEAVKRHAGGAFTEDANEQLSLSINAVFESWSNHRAAYYRCLNGIPDDLGTAVTIQAMVFGNAGLDSGTGVGFTRNPSTGAAEIFGEFLVNAQGEDIVAGTRTPVSLAELATSMPQIYNQLAGIVLRLERHYRDAQDFESLSVANNGLMALLLATTYGVRR